MKIQNTKKRTAKSPYRKYGKRECRYPSTPLNREGSATPGNIRKWEAAIGLVRRGVQLGGAG